MKWYLNSGSASHLYAHHFFTKKCELHNIKTLLIIAHHHHKGPQQAFDRLLKNEPKLKDIVDYTFF